MVQRTVVLKLERDSKLAIILAQSTHKLFLLFLVWLNYRFPRTTAQPILLSIPPAQMASERSTSSQTLGAPQANLGRTELSCKQVETPTGSQRYSIPSQQFLISRLHILSLHRRANTHCELQTKKSNWNIHYLYSHSIAGHKNSLNSSLQATCPHWLQTKHLLTHRQGDLGFEQGYKVLILLITAMSMGLSSWLIFVLLSLHPLKVNTQVVVS